MAVIRGTLAIYLVVAWVACLFTFVTDGYEGIVLTVIPLGALFVALGSLQIDGGDGLHMTLLAGLALTEVAVLYAVAKLLLPREQHPGATPSEQT